MQSLFAEQIEHDEHEIFRLYEYAGDSSAESTSYFRSLCGTTRGQRPHLEFLEDVKRQFSLPIIASLNGTSPGKWVRFAKMFELAGADALELNILLRSHRSRWSALTLKTDTFKLFRM